jgi:hypothetical protein
MLQTMHESETKLFQNNVDRLFHTWIDQSVKNRRKRQYFYYHTDVESITQATKNIGYLPWIPEKTFNLKQPGK